jgi:signal transduction histidine kinase
MTGQASSDQASSERAPLVIPWWSSAPLLIVVGGSIGAAHPGSRGHLLLVAVLSGLAGLAVLTALVRPRLSVLANGLAVATYFGCGLDNGPIFLTVPLVAVLAAQRARPRPLLAVLVPALALILAGLTVRSQVHGASATVTFWQGCGLTGLALAACVLGWWLTDRRTGRRDQAQRTATEERLRMAQDLHDGVGHGLAVISMHAAVALHVLDKQVLDPGSGPGSGPLSGVPAQLRQSLEIIRDTGRESLDALRVQVAAISTGPGTPGVRRPAPGLPELDDLLARVRTGGLAVTRHGDPGELPEEVGRTVYAVVQESLTNVLRHARAARADVTLTRAGPELTVSVQDDGQGPGTSESVAGMGISGMQNRVERLGGTLESGVCGEGFRILVHLPVPV